MENNENKEIKISERSIVKELAVSLYKGETTIDKIKETETAIYLTNQQLLDSAYRLYINDKVKCPAWRFNLLLSGEGGTGKTSLANYLAMELTNNADIDNIEKTVFSFSSTDAGFNTYSNQPAIVWDEMRDYMIKDWGINKFLTATNNGRFNNSRIKVLYGVVKLGNYYNFITTSQPAKDFLAGLTDRTYTDNTRTQLTEPENPDQISRRFKYYLEFHKEQLDTDNQKTTINLYVYNPTIKEFFVFTDKYEKVYTWTAKTNDNNCDEWLQKVAKEISLRINKKILIADWL